MMPPSRTSPSPPPRQRSIRRNIASAGCLALVALAGDVRAAPPAYCRLSGYAPPSRAGARPVFVATAEPGAGIVIDGSNVVGGPALVVGLPEGTHRVEIASASARAAPSRFEIIVGRAAIAVPKGQTTAPLRPFRLSLVHVSRTAVVSSPRLRLVERAIRADELARYHCDPQLHAYLPPVASLLTTTEAACTAGNASACTLAADQWFSDVGVRRRDPVQGVKRFERGCQLGAGDSCVQLARMVEIGNGAPADPARAAAILDASCGAGFGKSCAARAWMLLPAGATLDDRARAVPLMKRACELDDGLCGPARDQQLRLACDRGDHEACELLDPESAFRAPKPESATGTTP